MPPVAHDPVGGSMSELLARVEAMRAISAAKESAKREQVRAAMPDDMAQFLDEWKEFDPTAKLTHLKTPTLELGRPGERGFPAEKMVLLDAEQVHGDGSTHVPRPERGRGNIRARTRHL